MSAVAHGNPLPPDVEGWDRVGHAFIGAGQHLATALLIETVADVVAPQAQPGGLEWHGSGPPESGRGGYVDPASTARESFSPNMDHGPPKGPHWDYNFRGADGQMHKVPLYPDTPYTGE